MFWETLWALILGFTLSGAVQAFVSKDEMQRVMGDHRPGRRSRATGFGMVSSSCSYAATAMAKSLFQKGADFVTAMVFMFASTNLVVELGIVLIVLMGWQFAAAEFVGGPIMIVLLALTGGFVVRGDAGRAGTRGPASSRHDDERATTTQLPSARPWRRSCRRAAPDGRTPPSYTIADITMLRRELVIGYGVAGFLAVLVPMHVWNDVFVQGHGFWTSVENVIVGPFIAFISFVCSIGNVPMAAALWHGGISFGGVISFIFADLIALPLVLIYRKYYGTPADAAAVRVVLRGDGRGRAGRRGLFSLAGGDPDVTTGARRHDALPVELHDVPQHRVPRACSRVLYWLYRNRGALRRRSGVRDRPGVRDAGREGERARASCTTATSTCGSARTAAASATSRRYLFFLTVRRGEVPRGRSSTSPTVRSRTVDSGSGRSC